MLQRSWTLANHAHAALPPGPSFFTTAQLLAALDATLAEPFRRTVLLKKAKSAVPTTLVGKPWVDAYEDKEKRKDNESATLDLAEIYSVVKGSSAALAAGRKQAEA